MRVGRDSLDLSEMKEVIELKKKFMVLSEQNQKLIQKTNQTKKLELEQQTENKAQIDELTACNKILMEENKNLKLKFDKLETNSEIKLKEIESGFEQSLEEIKLFHQKQIAQQNEMIKAKDEIISKLQSDLKSKLESANSDQTQENLMKNLKETLKGLTEKIESSKSSHNDEIKKLLQNLQKNRNQVEKQDIDALISSLEVKLPVVGEILVSKPKNKKKESEESKQLLDRERAKPKNIEIAIIETKPENHKTENQTVNRLEEIKQNILRDKLSPMKIKSPEKSELKIKNGKKSLKQNQTKKENFNDFFNQLGQNQTEDLQADVDTRSHNDIEEDREDLQSLKSLQIGLKKQNSKTHRNPFKKTYGVKKFTAFKKKPKHVKKISNVIPDDLF